MTIEFGLWRIDNGLKRLSSSGIDYEDRLEKILAEDISIAAPHLMVIGRQVQTSFGKVIDLLAMDKAGNIAVLELKRDKTYRDIVAQVLDYGSWVRGLRDDDLARIFTEYQQRYNKDESLSIDQAFSRHFKLPEMPDELNASHRLIIVAAELDESTERIVNYLAESYGLDINVIFFQFVQDDDRQYLCRAWLREPTAPVERIDERGAAEWNGEYYVSFGHDEIRRWDEAVQYGFVSAGGGTWYTNTLNMLNEGNRIWVNVPGQGYVGVGVVTGTRQSLQEFMVETDAGMKSILDVSPSFNAIAKEWVTPEQAEYVVPVKWLKTVPLEKAIRERGLFGNQNTVARPSSPKWQHTIERLKQRLEIQLVDGVSVK